MLEGMVPELEDLEARGYFSRTEIRVIVAKRQDFEYALRRRAPVKTDFLRYAEYESSLERLRQLRRKQRGIGGPSTLADHCIVRRVHLVYQRACRKFRGDLALWAAWLRFCRRSKSSRQMSRVLTRALQLHPTCAALWTHAAAWEFEGNGNATAARALMQQGLRVCPEAHSLWHEYFRMELLYASRLVARRQVLGLALGGGSTAVAGDEDDALAGSSDAAALAVLRGAVAKVVYNSAVAAVSGSLPFRAGFLDVLAAVQLPGKKDLEEHILSDIKAAFEGTPGAVALAAQRAAAADGGGLPAALAVFREGLQALSSAEMYDGMVGFLEGELQAALDAGDAAAATAAAQEALKALSEAVEAGKASERTILALPLAHMRLGQVDKAVAAEAGAEGGTAAVVRQQLTATALAAALTNTALPPSSEELVRAVSETEGGRRVEVWCAAIRSAVASGAPLEPLCDVLINQQRCSARGPVSGGVGVAAAALVTALWSRGGPEAARAFYRSMLTLPLPGGELVHAVLDAELALAAAGDGAALPPRRLREMFESGAAAYGAVDDALWLRFLKYEQGQEGGKGAGAVHWRAVKALADSDAFVARAHLEGAGAMAL